MANMKSIRKKLGDTVCRRCIANSYGVDLQPPDCKYAMYPDVCDCCKQVSNIVVDLNPSGKRKLFFR